jgi:hypothetical protein
MARTFGMTIRRNPGAYPRAARGARRISRGRVRCDLPRRVPDNGGRRAVPHAPRDFWGKVPNTSSEIGKTLSRGRACGSPRQMLHQTITPESSVGYCERLSQVPGDRPTSIVPVGLAIVPRPSRRNPVAFLGPDIVVGVGPKFFGLVPQSEAVGGAITLTKVAQPATQPAVQAVSLVGAHSPSLLLTSCHGMRLMAGGALASHLAAARSPRYPAIVTAMASH